MSQHSAEGTKVADVSFEGASPSVRWRQALTNPNGVR
jgi:hypothetical protein